MNGINPIDINGLRLEQAGSVYAKDDSAGPESGRTAAREDAVVFSERARAIDRLAGLVNGSRAERLAQLRERLEAGTYAVSGREVARKIIELNGK